MEEILAALLREISKRDTARHPFVISIDGRCAAGKTTLAARLSEALQCPTVHLDDFFLRPEQRTPERYAQPGGNVDRERFTEEVLLHLRTGDIFSYRPYNFHRQMYLVPVRVDTSNFIVIEGSYSCHPELWTFSDLHVFLTIDELVQKQRIINRGGEQVWPAFCSRWIPLEEKYFAAFSIETRCELCFDTGKTVLES